MAKVEVILTHNIDGLGAESDQVKVAAGYARNYLLPRGYAVPLTGANKRRLEVLRQRRAEREVHELGTMTELSKSLSKLVLPLKVKTGDDGRMFGSVTAAMIVDELLHQFDVSLDRKKLQLEESIRTVGMHEVPLRLHTDVDATLKVRIESTNPVAIAAAEAAEAAEAERAVAKAARAPTGADGKQGPKTGGRKRD